MFEFLLSLDTALLISARGLVGPQYAPIIQILGESIVIWTALFLLGLWLYGVKTRENDYKVRAMQIFSTIILTFIVYSILNFSIDKWRPSPQEVVGGIAALIPHPLDNSFPSGHALFTGALLVGLIRFFGNPWIIALSLILGCITALSRVVGGVHYPGDILGGWICGGIGGMIFAPIVSKNIFTKHIFPIIIRIAHFIRL